MAAAGDRHLAEFCPGSWYLRDPETVADWHFALTTVSWREENRKKLVREAEALAGGEVQPSLKPSGEELVRLMRGILGLENVISNVNLPNEGQMPGLRPGSVCETNCVFTNGFVRPIVSRPLPEGALGLVRRSSDNIDLLTGGIRERDTDMIFASFINQPLCEKLSLAEAKSLFAEMMENTREYLSPYYNL